MNKHGLRCVVLGVCTFAMTEQAQSLSIKVPELMERVVAADQGESVAHGGDAEGPRVEEQPGRLVHRYKGYAIDIDYEPEDDVPREAVFSVSRPMSPGDPTDDAREVYLLDQIKGGWVSWKDFEAAATRAAETAFDKELGWPASTENP